MRAALLSLVLVLGCTSPIVGAECAPGFSICGASCVELSVDPDHCGACETPCADGQSCSEGRCGGQDGGVDRDAAQARDAGTDAGAWDAGAWDAGARDASPRDASPRDAGTSDAGTATTGCEVGELRCGRECVRPSVSARHCGGCDVACAMGEFCIAGSCTDACLAPRATCGDVCVNIFSDPDHCGGCSRACPSGVCSGGTCQEALPGHLVLIGHDFRTSRESMSIVAGNAVFLARENPTRVVVYEGDALPEAIAGTDAAFDRVAATVGRSWSRVVVDDPLRVPLALEDAHVFVVYAQTNADDARIFDLSKVWGRALSGFLTRGGVLVVFDGSGANAGTHRVLVHAGLMNVERSVDISRRVLDVMAPGDALALGLPLRYRAELSSVRFVTSEATAVVVDGVDPVVIHRIVLP